VKSHPVPSHDIELLKEVRRRRRRGGGGGRRRRRGGGGRRVRSHDCPFTLFPSSIYSIQGLFTLLLYLQSVRHWL
jgi:hypothetical protein